MLVNSISSVNSNNMYVKKSARVNNPIETNKPDSVTFKGGIGCDFSAIRDPYIRRYAESYVRHYDCAPKMRNAVQVKFDGLRTVLNSFPESDRREFYDLINMTQYISDVLQLIRKPYDPYFKRIADASRRDSALPILVHNNEVLASIHNAGTYGSDNGGNLRSIFDFGTEDFSIIFHRPVTPEIDPGFAKISLQAFSKDVDGDLMYTKAPNFEYTFYGFDGSLKRLYETGILSLDGHTSELREYDRNGNLIDSESLGTKLKKFFGF